MKLVQRFSKILVAIDFSENSMRAAEFAISIAERNRAQLVVLHVLHIPNTELYLTTGKKYKEYSIKIGQDLQEWFYRINKTAVDNQVKVKTDVIKVTPNVASAIADYADKNGIDLIIVGTRGKSGLKKLLLGSVAAGVVAYASCHVLVIK
ncbi:Universal stress protein [uncultured archaeon]|nr:Universal stress protein [uncultured archaeon]